MLHIADIFDGKEYGRNYISDLERPKLLETGKVRCCIKTSLVLLHWKGLMVCRGTKYHEEMMSEMLLEYCGNNTLAGTQRHAPTTTLHEHHHSCNSTNWRVIRVRGLAYCPMALQMDQMSI